MSPKDRIVAVVKVCNEALQGCLGKKAFDRRSYTFEIKDTWINDKDGGLFECLVKATCPDFVNLARRNDINLCMRIDDETDWHKIKPFRIANWGFNYGFGDSCGDYSKTVWKHGGQKFITEGIEYRFPLTADDIPHHLQTPFKDLPLALEQLQKDETELFELKGAQAVLSNRRIGNLALSRVVGALESKLVALGPDTSARYQNLKKRIQDYHYAIAERVGLVRENQFLMPLLPNREGNFTDRNWVYVKLVKERHSPICSRFDFKRRVA